MNPIANSSSTSVIAGTEHGGGSDPDALLLGSEHLRWCIFPAEVAAAIESGTDLCPSAAGPSMMMAPQPQSKEVKHAEAIEPARYMLDGGANLSSEGISRKRPLIHVSSEPSRSSASSSHPHSEPVQESVPAASSPPRKKTKFVLRDASMTAPARAEDACYSSPVRQQRCRQPVRKLNCFPGSAQAFAKCW